MTEKGNIVLIGFMGAGKTAVGRALAQLLSLSFVDTDALIEARTGLEIRDIFAREGEPSFREKETEVIKDVASGHGQVIAVGGGAVLRAENVKALREAGLIVYLKATPQDVLARIEGTNERPLLKGREPKEAIEELLKSREEIYEKVADITVDTSGLRTPQVAEEVRKRLG